MALTEIPINLTAFTTTEPPTNITTDPLELLNEIISVPNELVGGLLAFGILITLFVIMYYALSDKTPSGDFLYSDLRAMGIAFSIVSIVGSVLVQVGFIQNFVAVAFMSMAFLVTNISILTIDNKE